MKSGPRDVFPVLVAVGTVACGQDGRSSGKPWSEVRDSAGIQIIENARPSDGSRLPWRIGPQPTASLPLRTYYGYHYPQRQVPDAIIRLRDGRIAIVHTGYSLAYDISGSPSGKWRGQYDPVATEWPLDPGQSWEPDGMAPWPGDSIIGWGDFPRDTEYGPRYVVSVFDAIGNHGRFFALSSDDPDLRVVDGTKDGLILTVSGHYREEDSIAVQLWDSEGELRSSLETLPILKRYDLYGDGSVWFPTIFGYWPVHAPWGELIVVGNTNRYELRAYRADGSLARIVRRDHVLRSTPDDVEWHESVDSRMRQALQSVPVADHYPVFERVLADASGHLWVLEYPVPMEERTVGGAPGFPFTPTRDLEYLARMNAPFPLLWTVFDPDGRVLGFVETPAGLEIVEIGEDYILGSAADYDPNFPSREPNIQLVELWPLERWGGPRSGK